MKHALVIQNYRAVCTALLATATLLTASASLFSSVPPALTCQVEPERSMLAADKPESIMVKVTLRGCERAGNRERSPINLALVIDRSGSMSGDRIAQAKEAAIAAVERLTASDIISVVIFDHTIDTIVPAQHVRNKREIVARIREINARGNTAIFGGVSQAAAEVRKNIERGYINRIVLLSDGKANVGPQSPADLGRLGVSMMKEKISVTTVGVGLGYNEDLMTRLASTSDGNSYFVENSEDLPRIFKSELGSVLSVVAKSVRLSVRFASGATPVEIVGRDGHIDGKVVTLDFNQVYSEQEKYVLIRTECDPGRSGDTRTIAQAEVSFVEAESNKSRRVAALGTVSFSENLLAVRESVRKDVVREAALNYNAKIVEEAIRLADEGKREEAAQLFEKQAANLKKQAAEYGLDELNDEATYQGGNAYRVKSTGLDARSRKENIQRNFEVQQQQLNQ